MALLRSFLGLFPEATDVSFMGWKAVGRLSQPRWRSTLPGREAGRQEGLKQRTVSCGF